MQCGCSSVSKQFFIEGEYGADPVWCSICEYNIELDALPVDESLLEELLEWGNRFGEWIDLETNQLVSGGELMEHTHNKQGALLAKKLQLALGGVSVAFNPSSL